MNSKYDEYYDGIESKMNIYDSFLTEIELVPKEETSKSGIVVEIDNTGIERIYPKVTISDIYASEGSNLINTEPRVGVTEDINAVEIVLDFENQTYEADNENIIDKLEFKDDERFYIKEDEVNEIELADEGIVEYHYYPDEKRIRFVENFVVNAAFRFNDKNTKLIDEDYDFDLGKYKTSDDNILKHMKNGDTFRVKYRSVELEDFTSDYNYLVGCKLTDWDYNFNQMGDIILTNISGVAKNLL